MSPKAERAPLQEEEGREPLKWTIISFLSEVEVEEVDNEYGGSKRPIRITFKRQRDACAALSSLLPRVKPSTGYHEAENKETVRSLIEAVENFRLPPEKEEKLILTFPPQELKPYKRGGQEHYRFANQHYFNQTAAKFADFLRLGRGPGSFSSAERTEANRIELELKAALQRFGVEEEKKE